MLCIAAQALSLACGFPGGRGEGGLPRQVLLQYARKTKKEHGVHTAHARCPHSTCMVSTSHIYGVHTAHVCVAKTPDRYNFGHLYGRCGSPRAHNITAAWAVDREFEYIEDPLETVARGCPGDARGCPGGCPGMPRGCPGMPRGAPGPGAAPGVAGGTLA